MKKLWLVSLVLMAICVSSTPVLSKEDGGVRGLKKRMDALESLMKGIELSGVIEVEAGFSDYDFDDPAENDESSSDLAVATVEFGVDASINEYVMGHVLFLYEDDESVAVDEASIHFTGGKESGWYVDAGKLYVPFGNFESHFVSDPLTLELGETRETAIIAGFEFSGINLAAGIYNGDMDETDEDDHIEDYVASITYMLPEETVEGFGFVAGVSFVSDIADSDGLSDFLDEAGSEVGEYVAGYCAFLSMSIMDKFAIELEYLAAADDFADTPALGADFEPSAWNAEFAYVVMNDLEIAARYGGSSDTLDMLPETQYGIVAAYGLFENTSIAVELMHSEFESDDEENLVTAQLAIEF